MLFIYSYRQNRKIPVFSPAARVIFGMTYAIIISVISILEFWESYFKCRYLNTAETPFNKKYRTPCTGKEKDGGMEFEKQLQFVSDAVMAFAHAFR